MARLTITCIVRRFCLDCQGFSAKAVHECADTHCALWEYREPTSAPLADAKPADSASLADSACSASAMPTPRKAARRAMLRAVRRHCMLCAASRAEVRTCAARECDLWSYRFGVYPETYRAVRQRFLRPKTLSLL